MASGIEEKLNDIDDLIRAGKGLEAASLLRKIRLKKVPPKLHAKLASLARRAQEHHVALRLLSPIIRPLGDRKLGGSPSEQVEYAAALIKIGAITEGIDILNSVQNLPPDGLLYKAFAHVALWDYKLSVPLLEKYCSLSTITPYQIIIGNINLAAALVFERSPKAPLLLEQNLKETKANNHTRLYGTTLYQKAQWMMVEREFTQARKLLQEAEKILKSVGGLDSLFVDKFNIAIDVIESKGSQKSLEELKRFRENAKNHLHWETVRDCDLYEAVGTQNEDLAVHLYIGSPFSSYRKRIFRELGRGIKIPDYYLWRSENKTPPDMILDIFRQKQLPNGEIVDPGKRTFHTLMILSSDFYRPFNTAALHAKLFPTEFYNPLSSINRIHQIMKRLRKWLVNKSLPITIDELSGTYSLSLQKGCALWVSLNDSPATNQEILLESFRSHFSNQPFSTKQASETFQLPTWTIQRTLSEGIRTNNLKCSGKGTRTRYQFLSAKDKLKKAS